MSRPLKLYYGETRQDNFTTAGRCLIATPRKQETKGAQHERG
jgi:hypothetical protein